MVEVGAKQLNCFFMSVPSQLAYLKCAPEPTHLKCREHLKGAPGQLIGNSRVNSVHLVNTQLFVRVELTRPGTANIGVYTQVHLVNHCVLRRS